MPEVPNNTTFTWNPQNPTERIFQPQGGPNGSPGVSGRSPGSGLEGLPHRPSLVGSLVERDNQFEIMVFHFNPTSYKIKKKSRWKRNQVTGGTDTVEWTGSDLTEVTFTLLFNDLGQHYDRRTGRDSEDSLRWLYSRCRARTEDLAKRKTAHPRSRNGWMGVRDPQGKNSAPPPVLVLFGLSAPFECVLEDLDASTVFLGPSFLETAATPVSGDARDVGQAVNQRAAAGAHESNFVKRATVEITLLEYVNAPSAQG